MKLVFILDSNLAKMFSQWSHQMSNIQEEKRGLQQRRAQTGTTDAEKAAIDQRLRELEQREIDIMRERNAHACTLIVS